MNIEEISINRLVPVYLMSSYLYYKKDESKLTDGEFDMLCKRMLENWKDIKHPHKKLIKKKLSFFEGGHQLEKLEFALAIAQTKGDEKKSISLRKRIVELGGNVEEPGT